MAALNCELLRSTDLDSIVRQSFKEFSPAGHHVRSYNKLINTGLTEIFTNVFVMETTINKEENPDGVVSIHVKVDFSNVIVQEPIKPGHGEGTLMTPAMARRNILNYTGKVKVDVKITATIFYRDGAQRENVAEIKDHEIMSLPIMLGSNKCNLHNKSWAYKVECGEDPLDPGSGFILHGKPWSIDCTESVTFNLPRITPNSGYQDEVARLQMLCKPGDGFENSSDIILRHHKSGAITLEFTSITSLPIILKDVPIPITILFRLFGMSSDREIIDNILYSYSSVEHRDEVSSYMLQVLRNAFETTDKTFGKIGQIRDYAQLHQQFTAKVAEICFRSKSQVEERFGTVERLQAYFAATMQKTFCKFMLPHMGMTQQNWHEKLRYLCHLVHSMLLVELGVAKPVDHENLKNKRIYAAGQTLSRDLKMTINTSVVQPALRNIEAEFRAAAKPENVDLRAAFVAKISSEKLTRTTIHNIASAKRDAADTRKNSRITSEQIMPKNELFIMSMARLIRGRGSLAKANKRSLEMRSVHPSYLSAYCPTQSADTGDQVGLIRQLCIMSIISAAGDSNNLRMRLLADPDIIPLVRQMPEHVKSLTKIMVNGCWIGGCRLPLQIVRRYRELRRGYAVKAGPAQKLDPRNGEKLNALLAEQFEHDPTKQLGEFVSIQWDTYNKIIHFWIDAGRIMYPLLVVRNNDELDPVGQKLLGTRYDPHTDTGFRQDVVLRRAQLGNSIADLIAAGVIDYVSADETEGLLVAPSLEALSLQATNSLLRYTHCCIPVSTMGIPALTCPYMTYNQSPRVVYQTNQAKQTCGQPSLMHADRTDKSLYWQWTCQRPLIETIANDLIYPNGTNVIVAIYDPNGDNQEDSIIACATSSQRNLFTIQHYVTEAIEIKDNCNVETPSESTTGRVSNGNFGHLVNGLPPIGTVLTRGDVLVGVVETLSESNNGRGQRNASVVYDKDETIIIEDIIETRDFDDKRVINIKYSKMRAFGVGHKFSSRHGQKAMTGQSLATEDMPYTACGLTPDIVLSPHAIPSRMTIGQLIEGIGSEAAALRGAIDRASAFTRIEVNDIGDELERLGAYRAGTKACYDGLSGRWINMRLFMCPTFYQRLQKFCEEELYSVTNCKKDPITQQPTEGRQKDGGLRFGEMEKDCVMGTGTGTFNTEMTRDNSDPFTIYVCATCKQHGAIVNRATGSSRCPMCDKRRQIANIHEVKSSSATLVWLNEMAAAGLAPSVGPKVPGS